jgi:hypothetical protein
MAIGFLVVVLGTDTVVAQAPFRYREYALGSSVASVVQTSKTRADGVKTMHERPARIEELESSAPYVPAGTELADPVREILFSFVDDQLYEVVVTYDRDRIEGLTKADLIEAVSATYGVPLLRHGRTAKKDAPIDMLADMTPLAQWDDAASLVTLTRGTSLSQYQLVLTSKSLNPRARAAIKEALRLDTQEAPQRERDQRTKEVADARVASEKARVVNKAAFKP